MNRRLVFQLAAVLATSITGGIIGPALARKLPGLRYAELIRNTTLLAESELISQDLVDHMLDQLANLDPERVAVDAAIGFADIASNDAKFIEEIDEYVGQFSDPKDALKQFNSDPSVFLQRPTIQQIAAQIAQEIKTDAILFLDAADRIGSGDFSKYLPQNLPVSRDRDKVAAESVNRCPSASISAVVGAILSIIATVIASVSFGAVSSLIVAAVVATSSIIGAQIGSNSLKADIEKEQNHLIELVAKTVSKRSSAYVKAARKTAKDCDKIVDIKERRACLEAALVVCANAY